jgi:hypothetical protein
MVAALIAMWLPAASSSSAQNAQVTFDAASVKRNDAGQQGGGVGLRPSGYAAANVLLRTIIAHAHQMRRAFVVGARPERHRQHRPAGPI